MEALLHVAVTLALMAAIAIAVVVVAGQVRLWWMRRQSRRPR